MPICETKTGLLISPFAARFAIFLSSNLQTWNFVVLKVFFEYHNVPVDTHKVFTALVQWGSCGSPSVIHNREVLVRALFVSGFRHKVFTALVQWGSCGSPSVIHNREVLVRALFVSGFRTMASHAFFALPPCSLDFCSSSVSFPFFSSASLCLLWFLFIDPEELIEWSQLWPHVLRGWE
ncbi:unnamed protein product [Prunus armeniaca]|uniref:Uncharacterized protein n=1 Tax=Prunus armeniaca TaxID=36596 RepID=A0A6J5WHN8_PRUAR|nr:unnamed protein product [Prunus armeniaca]